MTAPLTMLTEESGPALGARPQADGSCAFRVWAPHAETVELRLLGESPRSIEMSPGEGGFFEVTVPECPPGTKYAYRLNGGEDRPDPTSRSQPEGVHGPSEVVDLAFDWGDGDWSNPPLREHIFYELHVGTFAPEETFDAVIGRIDDLLDLGVTAVQLMPVAQFPGERNWGYDGVNLYAAQNSYGGVRGLQRLVDACHRRGLAVYLDVVYNHLGPEGNYLREFGPYFTDRYHTPWGEALNFDGSDSDPVREFFIQNALYWVEACHIDGLRLDAIHAIVDSSPLPFIEELAWRVQDRAADLGRRVHVIAESAANDARLLWPRGRGGIGMDAQWNDDFHHVVHTLLTGECGGYYASYGELGQLEKTFRDGFAYTGEYSPFHRRRHGRPSTDVPPSRFVVFSQNHDQVGNRREGERLSALAGFESAKLAAGLVLLSPFVPMLFMGEEYAESAPFLYFVSHTDPDLVEAVRKGRREEFSAFGWKQEPPDPQAVETFERSSLDWSLREQDRHSRMLDFYRHLIGLRRTHDLHADDARGKVACEVDETRCTALLRRTGGSDALLVCFNLSEERTKVALPAEGGAWGRIVDSADERWAGPGALSPERLSGDDPDIVTLAPRAFAAYIRGG